MKEVTYHKAQILFEALPEDEQREVLMKDMELDCTTYVDGHGAVINIELWAIANVMGYKLIS